MQGPCEPVEGRPNSADPGNDLNEVLNENLNENLNNAERHRGSESNLADRSFTRRCDEPRPYRSHPPPRRPSSVTVERKSRPPNKPGATTSTAPRSRDPVQGRRPIAALR